MKNIGITLKSLREERGYTLRQLAQLAQVPYSYLSTIENMKRMPGLDVVDRICHALGVPVRDVIIKTELEKNLKSEKVKLHKELMPYFRKLEVIANQIYGTNLDDTDEFGDDNERNQGTIHPIIKGGGAKSIDHLTNKHEKVV